MAGFGVTDGLEEMVGPLLLLLPLLPLLVLPLRLPLHVLVHQAVAMGLPTPVKNAEKLDYDARIVNGVISTHVFVLLLMRVVAMDIRILTKNAEKWGCDVQKENDATLTSACASSAIRIMRVVMVLLIPESNVVNMDSGVVNANDATI